MLISCRFCISCVGSSSFSFSFFLLGCSFCLCFLNKISIGFVYFVVYAVVVLHSRRFLRFKSSASNQSVLDVFEFLAPVCVPVSSSSLSMVVQQQQRWSSCGASSLRSIPSACVRHVSCDAVVVCVCVSCT
jgi:hypothetical protein